LGDNKIKTTGTSRDINGNYLSDEGMPWAISFIDDFKVPKERCVSMKLITILWNG
jgi:hypothetical protein